jgi:hypothetical protein
METKLVWLGVGMIAGAVLALVLLIVGGWL